MELVCKFCTEVILAKKNSGYIRSFFAYKAQKLLIISKNIHKCHLLNESSFVIDYFVYLCVQIKDICK